jgi:hypothetical protein
MFALSIMSCKLYVVPDKIFVLLSTGIGLYMYEYAQLMSLLGYLLIYLLQLSPI